MFRSTPAKAGQDHEQTGRAKGFARGIATYDISVSAVIPDTNEPDWENLEGVKISIYPLSNSGKRTSYLDCFTVEVGEKYTVDSEAKIDIKMAALRKVTG